MIIATNQCGCPPKKPDPPCSPCCASSQRNNSKPSIGCSSSKSLKSILSRRKIQEPGCCPIKPPEPEEVQVCKIHSEIEERGLPYKVLEAIINDNKLVIRTQKEPLQEEFDPPCDCTEDPRSKVVEEETKQSEISENRTLTVFPQCSKIGEENGMKQRTVKEHRARALEENPNIFRLRVKKISKDGQNIDLEFRTPRAWSAKMIAKHEQALLQAIKPQECETKEDKDEDVKETKAKKKKKRRRRSRSRKKKDECGEILGKPPCGQIKRRKTDNC